MKIQRVNDKTIHCIITKEDLEANGIGINDLFSKKDQAVRFIKGILRRAAEQERISFIGEYTSMKISVLPDQSVSITISVDNVEAAEQQQKEVPDIYLFGFSSMQDVLRLAEHVRGEEGIKSSLYEDKENGGYHLVVERDGMVGADYERLVLSMNEFGTLLSSTPARVMYLKEHEKCILREDALNRLWEL